MKQKHILGAVVLAMVLGTVSILGGCGRDSKNENEITLTNVSYDPTRDLYEQYNPVFQQYYKQKTGKDVHIIQSHGGSGSQARSVVEGVDADVVTLALEHDIELVQRIGLLKLDWVQALPNDSSPYTSTIVFLVRKGNPKQIKDWDDLAKPGVNVITPDPKSSGGACWNFLAAWAYGQAKYKGDEKQTQAFVADIYKNVSVMDSGARGATTTFVENGQGDVLIDWENEALHSVKEYPGQYEIVTPSISVLAQPTVAVVDKIAKKHGVTDAATEYLQYLYSDEGQRIIGQNGYRPLNPEILKEFAKTFDLQVHLVTIADFGGWDKAYERFFDDGAIFDTIMDDVNAK